MIVTFKTAPAYFEQEADGRKNNTVRKVDDKDDRFKWLKANLVDEIQIISSGNLKYNFRRKITDVTFWEDLVIITWRHEE